jgi:hypothetical protein
VRRVLRCCLEGLDHDRLDHVIADLTGRAWARGIGEPLETIGREPVAPLAHGHPVDSEPLADLGVCPAFGHGQHDPTAQRQRLRRRVPPRPPPQRPAFLIAELDPDRRPTCSSHHRLLL